MHTITYERGTQAFTEHGVLAPRCLISLLQRQDFIQASTEKNGASHTSPAQFWKSKELSFVGFKVSLWAG